MNTTIEIMGAGLIVILLASIVYFGAMNFETMYDWGCEWQRSMHPNEYSKCVQCSKTRPNKHMTNKRGEGWICDEHLGLEN